MPHSYLFDISTTIELRLPHNSSSALLANHKTLGATRASGSDLAQTFHILVPRFSSHPQEHVLGFASCFNETGRCQFLDMVRQRGPGDWDHRPQINTRDLILSSCNPFKNFEPPSVNEGSCYTKKRSPVH